MLLAFKDAANLRTKKILFEDYFCANDASTLEHLRDLSSWRKVVRDSTDKITNNRDETSKEMAGGQTSQSQQILQNLEQYLPLLENLLKHVKSIENTSKFPDFRIRWTSALTASNCIKIGGPKFFHINDFGFELGMCLFLYGAILRERAFETSSTDLAGAATIFRKAAGVFEHLASEVLAPLLSSLPKERPVELNSSLCYVMSRICLADAQATSARKAEEKRVSALLLSKLHYGVTQILSEATSALGSRLGESTNVSSRLLEFISTCSALHELRSWRSLAEGLQCAEQVGTAVSVVQNALVKAKKIKGPKKEFYRSVFNREIRDADEMLRKLEHEHEFVWNGEMYGANVLPVLEEKIIVSAIPYEPQRPAKLLLFKLQSGKKAGKNGK